MAEADYLILDRLGPDVELAFIEDLVSGTFVVECLTRDEIDRARGVDERYRDLRLGLADASLVVLASAMARRESLRSTSGPSARCPRSRAGPSPFSPPTALLHDGGDDDAL